MSRYVVSCKLAPCSQTPIDAARGLPVAAADGYWAESYAPGSLRLTSRTSVQLDHDTENVGSVDVVAACPDGWIHCDMIVEDPDEATLARLRPGVGVSLGATLLASDEDHHLRTRRILLAELEHVALTKEGQVAYFPGAQITAVRELGSKSARVSRADWRSLLPATHRDFADMSDESVVHERVTMTNSRGSIRWDGSTFVAA